MVPFVIIWFLTTISLLILACSPLGLKITGVTTTPLAAFLLGILDTFLRPALIALVGSYQWLSLGLLSVGLNGFAFWLTPNLVDGFQLRAGLLSALISPVAVSP